MKMEKDEWQKRGEGHRKRLREKFIEGGVDRFSDEEVVEFLLTLGTPRRDVKVQAREAMKRFGSLSGVQDFRDPRVVHQRQRLALGLQARDDAFRVHPTPDHLERDQTPDRLRLFGEEDFTHPTLAERAHDTVRTDL